MNRPCTYTNYVVATRSYNQLPATFLHWGVTYEEYQLYSTTLGCYETHRSAQSVAILELANGKVILMHPEQVTFVKPTEISNPPF